PAGGVVVVSAGDVVVVSAGGEVVVPAGDVVVGAEFRSRPVAHCRSSDVLSLLVTESPLPAHAT
ncbi:MAG TPA: hypothetical protein VFC03_15790, partial [Acidimicrobiales bacterium]|nr:hypothetical protein [Acidimicrobiales bacterium]